MGLLFNESVVADSRLWLWRIEEEETFFLERLNLSGLDSALLAKYTSPSRRLEWLASRFLLQYALGADASIGYDVEGRPLLKGVAGHISISHSHKLVAIIYHPSFRVGVDVEMVSPRPQRVATRFLDEAEQALVAKDEACEAITRAWCSKEALFKLMGQHCFTLKDDFKLTTVLMPSSVDAVFYVKPLDATQKVFFQVFDNHVVAYTVIQKV